MAYTPVNWQTGDTITAERLNRMDRGWDFDSTQLFSETVTTVDDGYGNNGATLAYQTPISAETLVITFDGVDYVCQRVGSDGEYVYGGNNGAPDFSEYPFYLGSDTSGNKIYTETVGTYTISASASAIETSSSFTKAVNSAVDLSMVRMIPMLCISGETTRAEIGAANSIGRLLYFCIGMKYYILTDLAGNKSNAVYSFIPADDNVGAGLTNNKVFYVETY